MTDVTRLYRYFAPSHYDLNLVLDSHHLTFSGTATIHGELRKAASQVTLHAKDLTITAIHVNDTTCDYTLSGDELTITLPPRSPGNITITINYDGTITKAMHGIYPAYTKDGSVIIGTQFESHHAREAFPCIDEPEAKATYDITLTAQEPIILSNMPVAQETKQADGTTTVRFATTPVMSSYLVAFVTGDLQHVATTTENGTEIAIWSSKDHDIESLVFPLEVAVKTTEFFNDYFGVPYPLPKCDHVALPDFSSGAMENWGLITYREIALITDPDTISTSAKEYIATVIAHEISHQWFGNLVTMQWWDDLWLNESFANFMEYFVIDAIYPDWNVMLNFAAHEALSAFRRDVLPGVQPVATGVHHPDEISTLFDPSIVYAKGSRLLSMAYHLVGDRNFRKGLQRYFKDYAYGTTTGQDLWKALGDASTMDVGSIMEAWIRQSGFPYLTITPLDATTVQLEQHPLTTTLEPSEKLWPIPLWQSDTSKLAILETRQDTTAVRSVGTRFNTVGGHYIPYYTSAEWKRAIYKQVRQQTIAPDARLLLLHDPLLLAKCGVISLVESLQSLRYYANETEESVWSVISVAISDTRSLIEGDDRAEQALKAYTYQLIKKQYARLGFRATAKDSTNDKKLRSIITSLAVYSEDKMVITDALSAYSSVEAIEELPADSRAAILTAAVRYGSDAVFTQLLHDYPHTTNGDIQLDIAGALCSSKKPKQLTAIITMLQDSAFVRLQDLDRFVIYLLRNTKSRQAAWRWLTTNWEWITKVFAQDKSYDNYPRYAGAIFSTDEWLAAYQTHFQPLATIPSLARNIDLGTKDIQAKIAWRQRDQQRVEDWLITQQTK